jgi:hypothetical protein
MKQTCKKINKKRIKKSKNKTRTKQKPIKKIQIMRGGVIDDCPICFEELNNPEKNITLKCGHIFHKECMQQSCNSSLHTRECKCPLCRHKLDKQEMNELGITMLPDLQQTSRITLDHPPRLADVEAFTNYVNNKLRAPTSRPLIALTNVLDGFIGTDSVPLDLMNDELIVFELETIRGSQLKRYRFIGTYDPNSRITINRVNRKYFRFIFSDIENEEDIVEDIEEV